MNNDLLAMVWKYLPEHKRQALKGWALGVITSRELKEIMSW